MTLINTTTLNVFYLREKYNRLLNLEQLTLLRRVVKSTKKEEKKEGLVKDVDIYTFKSPFKIQ